MPLVVLNQGQIFVADSDQLLNGVYFDDKDMFVWVVAFGTFLKICWWTFDPKKWVIFFDDFISFLNSRSYKKTYKTSLFWYPNKFGFSELLAFR